MSETIQQAMTAIYAYTFGMDTGNWELAVSHFAEQVDIDYSAVGMSKGQMSTSELQDFLRQLLGKSDLRVHTAISQVLENPASPAEFIAYYSVKHFKGQLGQAETFFVYGWYTYRLQNGRVMSLTINVTAMEGNPAVLA